MTPRENLRFLWLALHPIVAFGVAWLWFEIQLVETTALDCREIYYQ